jgi:transposase
VSRRVHGRYERRLLDTAAGGREVLICLTVRRFLCRAPACPKTTFAEQVSGLTSRRARRTPELTGVLEAVALALPDPAATTAPRVLGFDEFALRKRRRYDTLLVDVQTLRPVDILPERSAGSFAAWLEERPGTRVIGRDRPGSTPTAAPAARRMRSRSPTGGNAR